MTDAPATDSPATERSSYRWDFDVLRILAILGVVAIHVFGLILGEVDLKGTQTWYFAVILDIGAIWCGPVFVMISGALLLEPRMHRAGAASFLRKRAVRLLPALVVWHFVYLILVRRLMFDNRPTFEDVFVQFVDAKVYTALYFLWLILGLYLVAPILSAFLADGGRTRAVVTAFSFGAWTTVILALPGITAQMGQPRPRGDNAIIMFLPYIALFVAGYAWRKPQREGWRWLWTGVVALVLIAETIWQYDVRPEHPWLQALSPVAYFSPLVMIASVCLFICVIDLCARIDLGARSQAVLRALGAATFGVFLCHLVFVAVVRKWFPDFYADPTPVAKTQLYVLVVVGAFAVSLVAQRIPFLRRVM